jgi:hypothetical protein
LGISRSEWYRRGKPVLDTSGAVDIKKRRSKQAMVGINDAIKRLLEENHPQTDRPVYYALSVKGLVGKTEAEYKGTIVRLLVKLREKGIIPFDWIADHTRTTYRPRSFDNIAQSVEEAAESYRRRVWTDSACGVRIFVEKNALADVLYKVTGRYDVPLHVVRGYSSLSYLHEIAKAIKARGKPVYCYHFGDYDPSGQDAARDIEEKLRRYSGGATIYFERVAVTLEQIEEWSLPSRPTKTDEWAQKHGKKRGDTRAKKFGRDTSVELDAIPVDKLLALARARIKRHIRKKRFKALLIAEKKDRRRLQRIAADVRRSMS